jgi:uncharacterized protein DUF6690
MFSRPLLFVGVLAAAVLVPYVLLDEHLAQTARGQFDRLWGKSEQTQASDGTNVGPAAGQPVTPAASGATIEEAFRFDIRPQWVTSRWPRVSTVLGDPKQLGMRVALVSGTRGDDVAGSLTYYFDDHHQLQRITFTGMTGDPRRLLAAVVTPYGLKSLPTTTAARYVAGDPQKPTSEVIVRHLPVVRNEAEHARAEVAVDLRRGDALDWGKKASTEAEPSLIPSSYRRW